MEQLEGKVAVVTGGASGIGRAVAEQLVGAGMKVALADIEEGALAEAEKALGERGEVLAVPTDVSSGASVDALRDRVLDAFGAVHLVHNNAGVASGGLMWTLTEQDWAWVLGVNLWGVIHGIRAFVPLLVEQGEGHVVNTASIAGMTSAMFMGPYNASKHAVVTISETLYRDLQLSGSPVGVTVVCPGFVRTRIHEADRNRPASMPPSVDGPEADMGRELIRQFIEGGIPPEDVARQVLDAVRNNHFYVLTHPESREWVRARFDDILADRAPSGMPLA